VWCGVTVTLPLIYLVFIALNWSQITAPEILCAATALILLATAVIPVEIPNPRYIIPLGWIDFLLMGSMLAKLYWQEILNHGKHDAPVGNFKTES
jgi:hypothetical protein